MSKGPVLILIVLGLTLGAGINAAERKAYKYVDEKGNVVYSQTPPVDAKKDAKKIDIAPAQSGRGGHVTGARESDYSTLDRRSEMLHEQERRRAAQQEQKQRREEENQKKRENLIAECERNRGIDCRNPETLRRMQADRIPRGRY